MPVPFTPAALKAEIQDPGSPLRKVYDANPNAAKDARQAYKIAAAIMNIGGAGADGCGQVLSTEDPTKTVHGARVEVLFGVIDVPRIDADAVQAALRS